LERPLPWDLFSNMPATLHSFSPSVHNFGLVGASFIMKSKRYLGHFRETGFQAITMRGVANAWVRGASSNNATTAVELVPDSCDTV
jgi:hypothetical protein